MWTRLLGCHVKSSSQSVCVIQRTTIQSELSNTSHNLIILREFSRSSNDNDKTYYDVLNVPEDAEQADIKNSYYELSKLYHPDRNSNKKADQNALVKSQKFREITEAYEVLGNKNAREEYNKGLHRVGPPTNFRTEEDTTDPVVRFYQQHARRGKVPIYGKGPSNRYDHEMKVNYQRMLNKRQDEKEQKRMSNIHTELDSTQDVVVTGAPIVMLMCMLGYFYYCFFKGDKKDR